MNHEEMRRKIMEALDEGQKVIPAMTPEDKKIAGLVVFGLSLVGELLLDIKRIADGCTYGLDVKETEAVARWFAKKEAERKLGGPQVTDGPEERHENQNARQAWVNENWPAFQAEAADLIVAMRSDGGGS